MYKGVHTIRINLISSAIVMEEGSPERSTDIPPPDDNEQSVDIPPPDKLLNNDPLT
jgi:hypothetical protein